MKNYKLSSSIIGVSALLILSMSQVHADYIMSLTPYQAKDNKKSKFTLKKIDGTITQIPSNKLTFTLKTNDLEIAEANELQTPFGPKATFLEINEKGYLDNAKSFVLNPINELKDRSSSDNKINLYWSVSQITNADLIKTLIKPSMEGKPVSDRDVTEFQENHRNVSGYINLGKEGLIEITGIFEITPFEKVQEQKE